MKPTDAQAAVISSAAPKNLVLAGPGRGKTASIILLADQRGRSGCLRPGQKVLALTFARQAIFHLHQTVARSRLLEVPQWLEANTFHGFCHSVVRSFGRYRSGRRRLELLSPDLAEARLCEGEQQDQLDFSDSDTAVLSFSELVSEAVALLKDSGRLRRLYAESYPILVVDEVQDTDPSQWELVRLLSDGAQVFAFGDPAQHIYGWRGVPANRIEEIAEEWQVSPICWDAPSQRTNDAFLLDLGQRFLDPKLSLRQILTWAQANRRCIQTFDAERTNNRVYPVKAWLAKTRAGAQETNACAILTHKRDTVRAIAESLARPQERFKACYHCQLLYDQGEQTAKELFAHAWHWMQSANTGSLKRALALINARFAKKLRMSSLQIEFTCRCDTAAALPSGWPQPLSAFLDRTLVKPDSHREWARVGRKLGPLFEKLLPKWKNELKAGRDDISALFAETAEKGHYTNPASELIEHLSREQLAEAVLQKAAPLKGLVGMTMHASKGKEFDAVMLAPESYICKPETFEKPDNRRMWHVAVTRARRDVCFLLPDNWNQGE